jgi:hypothetical protein
MFLKVQLPWNVIIAAENLDAKGLMLQRAIIIRLLGDFAAKGGCPQGSEAWGPLEMWARLLLMPSYCYEGGESPLFQDNLSKIEKDIVVCFIVMEQCNWRRKGNFKHRSVWRAMI